MAYHQCKFSLTFSPGWLKCTGFPDIIGGEVTMAEMSKTAKAATKKAVVNLNVPQCCGKPMQAAKMMTTSGKVRGMMWLCDKCWKEKAI
jgi:hypothetical protein